MGKKNHAYERAMDLIAQGFDRPSIAHMMGYPEVQNVHNIVYYAKQMEEKRAEYSANPESEYKFRNVERVRKYLEDHPKALNKTIAIDLKIHLRTVARAKKLLGV